MISLVKSQYTTSPSNFRIPGVVLLKKAITGSAKNSSFLLIDNMTSARHVQIALQRLNAQRAACLKPVFEKGLSLLSQVFRGEEQFSSPTLSKLCRISEAAFL